MPIVAIPGDQAPDLDLQAACTAPPDLVATVFDYLAHGGVVNLRNMLRLLANRTLDTTFGSRGATAVAPEGALPPRRPPTACRLMRTWSDSAWRIGRSSRSSSTAPTGWARTSGPSTRWSRPLEAEGCTPLPIFCYSLKDDPDQDGGVPAVFRDYLIDGAGRRGSTSCSAR